MHERVRGWFGEARAACLAGALALSLGAAAAPPPKAPREVPPELPAETLGGGTLAGTTAERVYVSDVVIANIADGRLRVFDARAGKLLGMVNTGYAGNFALSAPRPTSCTSPPPTSAAAAAATAADVLEVWDTRRWASSSRCCCRPSARRR
jgi:methylamine dehydrogenase heavy chain